MKRNGQPSSKITMYSNIDQLAEDTQKVNYAAKAYSSKKKAAELPPKKSLMPSYSS